MARGHGRILTSIWEDEDFLALDEQQQRMYLFLISQPNLNHAGLLDLTLRRWSRKARGLTVGELEKRIAALDEARFIVVDDDTEELLIRSFVRNDGVWRMPKVMGAMVSGALEISSKRLQRALLAEMDRVPLGELSDEPTKLRNGTEGPSNRQQVSDHIETLRKAFGTPEPDPTEGGYRTPSGPPSETPSDPPAEGDPKASTRGRAPTSRAHSPAPAPTPAPNPSPEREAGAGEVEKAPAAVAEHSRPDGRPPLHELPDDFELNEGMRRWAQQTFPRVDVDHETQKFVWHCQGEGTRRRNWYAAWQKWIAGANQHLLKHGQPASLPVAAGAENVVHLGARRPSTADQRALAALALAAELAEEDSQS
ncbi:hypothetical protein [Streptomyces antimycoticus]